MQLRVSHITRYLYSMAARYNQNELRLAPEETHRQRPGSLTISVSPYTELDTTRDLFGNLVHSFEVEEAHGELVIDAVSEVETLDTTHLHEEAMKVPLRKVGELEEEEASVHEFLTDSTFVKRDPVIWREAVDIKADCSPTYGAVVRAMSEFIFKHCHYDEAKLVHCMTSAMEVQQCRSGTCQDFSHLLVAYCRALGIPARYISGYLYDPGLEDEGVNPEWIGAGVSHAWVEFFVPGLEWVGIDPTNNCWVNEHHVSVAFGRDYHDVAPIRGSLQGGGKNRKLEVGVEVVRI